MHKWGIIAVPSLPQADYLIISFIELKQTSKRISNYSVTLNKISINRL